MINRGEFLNLTNNDYSGSIISTGGDARDLNARISRAEYEDYKMRFDPIEGELNSLILDKDKRKAWHQDIIDYGTNNTLSAYNRANNNINQNQQKFGNVISAGEKKTSDRKLALQKANTLSQANTNARDYIRRADMNLLLGNSTAQSTVE
jgi:hypothetical protein